MPRHVSLALLLPLAMAVACGDLNGPKKLQLDEASDEGATPTALEHTPGYFRDVYRLLIAQQNLDDVTAATELQSELEARSFDPGALPAMRGAARDTLDGLLILGTRAVQATESTPANARKIATRTLDLSLGLDPALEAFNRDGGQAKLTAAGAATLATAAQAALQAAADDSAVICSRLSYSSGSSFVTGDAEVVWVEGVCEDDEWLEGFCEADTWVEGNCYEEWVPEECYGGEWVDQGYYEYYCYDDDYCDYIWREYWVYIDGTCDGGYWDEWCDSGYWETGLCYDGNWVAGECNEGHYEYIYPDGSWEFAALTVPEDCGEVRPRQFDIAVTAAQVLKDKAYDDLTSEWRSALDALLRDAPLAEPSEAVYEAILQVIDGARAGS